MKLEEGTVEVTWPTKPGWTGPYIKSSTDVIQGQPVWYKNGISNVNNSQMLFLCYKNKWRLTSRQYRSNLLANNGGTCGGFAGTAVGGTGPNPWEYTWTSTHLPQFEVPPPTGDTYEFYYTA